MNTEHDDTPDAVTAGDLDVGNLGETPQQHEERRVRAQVQDVQAPWDTLNPRAPAANPYKGEGLPVQLQRQIGVLVTASLREEFKGVRTLLQGLTQTMAEQAETVKTLDVPLEQVADSHERASRSFETLRRDIYALSDRLGKVEGVIDTAGLMDAHTKSSQLLADIGAVIQDQQRQVQTALRDLVQRLAELQGEMLKDARRREAAAARALAEKAAKRVKARAKAKRAVRR